MTTVYTVPDNPADPEAAALELIVRVPSDVLGHDSPPRDALQDFVSLLTPRARSVGMSWHDARHAATVIIVDAINQNDPARVLRARAQRVLDGTDNMTWDDRGAMVRALRIGAKVLSL